MQLRNYQQEQLECILKAKVNTVVQSPTGTGKSVVIKEYILEKMRCGITKIMVITPNKELVDNINAYFPSISTNAYSGVIPNLCKNILVCTYKSAAKYVDDFRPQIMVHDEVHHAPSDTWKKLFERKVLHIGFTATPNRLDGQGLYPLFRDIWLAPNINWFIENEYLSDYNLEVIECPLFADTSSDNLGEQEKVFGTQPEIHKTVDIFISKYADTKTIFFVTSFNHGEQLLKALSEKGYYAEFLTARTPAQERKKAFENFKKGDLRILINIQLFTEGVDIPDVESVFICRFTYSTALYLQITGRLLRRVPGVTKNLIDLAGNCFYHGTPKAGFDWSIHGENFRVKSNKDSVFHRCIFCDEILVHKKYIVEQALLSPQLKMFDVCCLECGNVNTLIPPRKKKPRDPKKYVGSTFELHELQQLDPELVSKFTRILANKKIQHFDKVNQILEFQSIPKSAKRKALLTLQIAPRTIDLYLDEE